MSMIENPIRKGFYPDPSVCRVHDTYYCVHSSFSYAPGIPIFKSSDLIDWEQIGHVLTTPMQLQLKDAETSGGIYAPTIRYHDGLFYVIVTNVTHGGNFYVTASNPAGEWSEPHYLPTAQGIDPSLYFEEDKCYYIGQRTKNDAAYFGDCEIWMQELDYHNHCLVGEVHVLWDGALKRAIWPEGPHLYKIGTYYYLLIAEGGTEYGHSICVARSKQLYGPYEACPYNPVFTHRHLGRQYPVQNAGHGDLVQAVNGRWYLFMLATRPLNGGAELGRETFLADVTWEEDWPVINSGEGKLRHWQEIENNSTETKSLENTLKKEGEIRWTQEIDMRVIGLRENILLHKNTDCFVEKEKLYLPFWRADFCEKKVPAFLGMRLQERNFYVEVPVSFTEQKKSEEAGIAYYYDEQNYIKLGIIYEEENGIVKPSVRVSIRETGTFRAAFTAFSENGYEICEENVLAVKGNEQKATFLLNGVTLLEKVDLSMLCSEKAGGFTGCVIGVYAYSEIEKNPAKAKFGRIKYQFN